MPNTPALVLAGCTGFCVNDQVNKEEKDLAEKLFSSFGKAIEVPERLMDTVGSVSGSSPAFVYRGAGGRCGGGRHAERAGAGVCGAGGLRQRETGAGERTASGRAEGYGMLSGRYDNTGGKNTGEGRYAGDRDGRRDRLRGENQKIIDGKRKDFR